jgi:signal transduction histidine kinase/ligand-binding sensor domain-containing protein/DNA-binding response OmpR family regulator
MIMHVFGKSLLTAIFLVLTPIAYSQDYRFFGFRQLATEHGLADNSINTIHQDKTGFIWIGTSYGLSRYDAYNIRNFRFSEIDSQSIINNNIRCIVDDTIPGNLWIGTQSGLCYFDRYTESFRNYNFPGIDNTTGLFVEDIILSEMNGLILATNRGVFIDKGGQKKWLTTKSKKATLYHDEILCILEDSYHQIWIGTRNGVDIYNPEENSIVHLDISIDSKNPLYVYGLEEDLNNNILLCTRYHGLIILYGGGSQNYSMYNSYNTDLKGNWISSALEMDPEHYLLSVRDVGLTLLNHKTGVTELYKPDIFDPYNKSNINSIATTCLYKDVQHNIWIGTYNNGVNMLDINKKPFRHYRVTVKPDGLINNHIRALFQDSDKRIWIGTKEEGGVSEFIPEKDIFCHFLKTNKPGDLNDDYIFCFEEFNKDTLLVGTFRGGINVFDKRNGWFTPVMHDSRLPRSDLLNAVYSIKKDSRGRIWVGTLKNLCLFNLHEKSFILIDSIFEVKNIVEDQNNRIWIASQPSGLYRYDEKLERFEKIALSNDKNEIISLSGINHIYVDSRNNLWLATGGSGIVTFDTESLQSKVFSIKDGLPTDQVFSVMEDNQGNIWASTGIGLSMLDLRNQKFNNYETFDGLQGTNFERQVCLKIHTGELIFGGNNGFNIFQPLDIKKNQFIPPVYITNLRISNTEVDIKDKESVLTQPIQVTKNVTLKHNQSDLTFEFTALNYSVPEKNHYAYMLQGYDSDWVQAGTSRKAVYTNIDPGSYVFRVKASNNDGIWNENDTSLLVRILPPFWNTWVAYLIYSLALAVIINAIVQYVKLKEKFRNDILKERLQRKKEEELHQLKLKFFTNISHEFRTPLTLIAGPLQEIIQSSESYPFRDQINMVYRNARSLLQQINQLMDFRQIEMSSRAGRYLNTNLREFINERIAEFTLLARQRNISIVFEPGDNQIDAEIDKEILGSIINNLLSNALKFSDCNTSIRISLNNQITGKYVASKERFFLINHPVDGSKQYFELIIEDSGIGISSDDLSKVFERYYHAENSINGLVPGTGIGLAIVKSYVESHGGNIIVESEVGKGTAFYVHLPFKNSDDETGGINMESFGRQSHSDIISNESPGFKIEEQHDAKFLGCTVLIVEDNEDMLMFLEQNLNKLYSVSKSKSGEEGIDMALRMVPDLIISDIIMPGMDGLTFCNQLKSDNRTSHIPVILLTAKDGIESHIQGIQTGADAYITKPFDIRILKVQIYNLLQQRQRLRTLFMRKISVQPSEVTATSLDEKFLQKALKLIEDHISDNNLNIDFLSKELGMSRSNLHLKIKALTDMSAGEFIKTTRLKRAIQLLSSGAYSVNEVAYLVGFSSPSYFTQSFKSHFNELPHHFIKLSGNFNQTDVII